MAYQSSDVRAVFATADAVAADPDGLAQSQTPGGAGSLVLLFHLVKLPLRVLATYPTAHLQLRELTFLEPSWV